MITVQVKIVVYECLRCELLMSSLSWNVCHSVNTRGWNRDGSRHDSWCPVFLWQSFHTSGIGNNPHLSERIDLKSVSQSPLKTKETLFHTSASLFKIYFYKVWDFALWDWEICTWREFVVLKCFPQISQLWLNPKWVSTWLLMCCFVFAVFPHFKHSNMPPEEWINWSR